MTSEMLTWKCDVCGEDRDDSMIGVVTTDLSEGWGLPPGRLLQNVRYCLDKECATAALHVRFLAGPNRMEKMTRILREAGRPMVTTEIVAELRKLGDGQGRNRIRFTEDVTSALRNGMLTGRFLKLDRATWAHNEAYRRDS